jgi:hypothetical protein
VVSKRNVLVLVGTLLLAWLLLSSIHLVQPITTSSSGGSSSSSDNGNGGNSNDGGSGFQSNGFSIFTLPSFNFSFPFQFPNIFGSWNFNWSLPNWFQFGGGGIGQIGGTGSGTTAIGSCFDSNCQGGNGTKLGSGSGGSGQQNGAQTNNSPKTPPQFVIPQQLLLIIIVVVVVLAGAGFIVAQRKSIFSRRKEKAGAMAPAVDEAPAKKDESAAFDQSELLGEERVSEFEGWGKFGGYIKPNQISENLPLIWSLHEPLSIMAPENTALRIGQGPDKELPLVLSPSQASNGGSQRDVHAWADLKETSNRIDGELNGIKETKWVRAVHYDEDVVKLFRLNLLNLSNVDLKSMTARELANLVSEKFPETIQDKSKLLGLTRIFERAFYGHKEIARKEYESFLLNLSGGLAKPKVIICGPKSQRTG